MTDAILIGNDSLIEIQGLQNEANSNYLNAATVTATLKDLNGADVPGAVGFTLVYVAASNGNYQGTLPDDVTLTDNQEYELWIDADSGPGLKGFWKTPVRAAPRRK